MAVEAEIKVEPFPASRFFANATAQRVRIVDLNQDSPGVSQLKGTAGADFDLGRQVTVYGAASFLGRRRQPDYATETPSDRYVSPYLFVSASLTFRTPLPGVEMQASGFNLLNAKIRDPFDGPALPDEIPGEGASGWLDLRLRF